jgi:hypothetical protein
VCGGFGTSLTETGTCGKDLNHCGLEDMFPLPARLAQGLYWGVLSVCSEGGIFQQELGHSNTGEVIDAAKEQYLAKNCTPGSDHDASFFRPTRVLRRAQAEMEP